MIHNGQQALPYSPDAALAHLRAADPKIGILIERAGPFRLKLDHLSSPFASLVESILYQQLHGKAAATIHGRLLALCNPQPDTSHPERGEGTALPAVVPHPARNSEVPSAEPTPQILLALPDERLRAAGVSGNKIKALRDLAARALDGTIPTLDRIRAMADREIVERLTTVRGIGPWTVEMLLIFRLGRPDVLPITDYGVRKGFAIAFSRSKKPWQDIAAQLKADDLPKPEILAKRGLRWAPYRSVAAWYLWRACDLAKPSASSQSSGRSSRE